MHQRIQHIAFNLLLGLQVLLVFLLLFENSIVLPAWLQVAGRVHPLILHFPVALVIVVAALALWQRSNGFVSGEGFKTILMLAALLSTFTALSGLLLSLEDGYDTDVLDWHQWSGVVLSCLLFIWVAAYRFMQASSTLRIVASSSSLLLVIVTGHWGATITHGEDFLLQPLRREAAKPTVTLSDAMVFEDMVQPILQSKCMNCHNSKKAKGSLVMETVDGLTKGGKNGKLWNIQDPAEGLMLQRLHLPEQHKKHMPPPGKPQLTSNELFIVEQWLQQGARFQQKVTSLPEQDTLRQIAQSLFNTEPAPVYDFDAASTDLIKKLNTANRSVIPLAANSPALEVNFYGRSGFQPAMIKELESIGKQIVSLNLNKMPVSDEDLSIIRQFKNLNRLNLAFTDITDQGITSLLSLQKLEELSLSGTNVNTEGVKKLIGLPSLKKLFVWETAIPASAQSQLAKALPATALFWGYRGDTVIMTLNPPKIENEKQIITEPVALQLKHYLPNVQLYYTLDGSEPDSVHATLYQPGQLIDKQALVRIKAYKQGWKTSATVSFHFFRNKFKADTIIGLQPADKGYKGMGAGTLNDQVKGDLNFRSGKWLGYKENPMEVLLQFKEPIQASSVAISSIVDIGSYIMPPLRIQVWGGDSPDRMKLLQTIRPEQPTKEIPSYLTSFECSFPRQSLRYLRVVATPVAVLPAWHRGKGDKGWVFADEIFVN